MEQKQITATYAEAVKAIKEAILESRYRAARLVNKEVLALYYAIGGYISVQSRAARWGSNAIGTISELLQQELPGLRGFSETSIKRMRIFYEAWCSMFENRPLSADDLQNSIIPVGDKGHIEIRPLTTDELPPETLDAFLAVGFTNHYEILAQKKDVEQRLFYIVNCATGFWNGDKLKYYMKDDLFGKRGNMPNNFATTIANVDLRSKALRSFKDEYLLDFVNIEDPDETDERVIEQQIVTLTGTGFEVNLESCTQLKGSLRLSITGTRCSSRVRGWAFLATGIADTAMGTADTVSGTANMRKSRRTF